MSNLALLRNASLIAIFAAHAAACQTNGFGSNDGNNALAHASLRAMHLSPDAPSVDVLASGREAATIGRGLSFHHGSRYAELAPGAATLDVVPAGTGVDQSVLRQRDVELEADRRYTAVVFGTLASPRAMVLEDDSGSTLGADRLRVRVIHTAVNVGPVDIWLLPVNGSPSLIYDNVDFGSVGPYLDLPTGAYELGIDVDNDAHPELVYSLPRLAAGTVANIFAAASSAGEVTLVAEVQDGTTADIDAEREPSPEPMPMPEAAPARLRALHLSPDAPAVNIYANGDAAPAVSGLAFGAGTDYLSLPAGEYDFDLGPAGGGIADSIFHISNLILESDSSYTAAAIGQVSSLRVLALQDRRDGLAAGNIRVRAIHAAAGVGEVDIWNIPARGPAQMIYENVEFGVAGEYLDLPAGAYTLGVDADNDADPDFVFELPALAAGTVANIFATRSSAGAVYLTVQLDGATIVKIDPKDLTPARLRVIHLSPDAPAVAVYANEGSAPVVDNLAFGSGTAYLSIPNGMYSFDIAPAHSALAASVLHIEDLALAANASYTAAAIGTLSSLRVLALEDDFSNLAPGAIRVRAIHAAAGVGRVNILSVPHGGAASLLYENVDFGVAGGYLDLPSGIYRIGLDVDLDHRADLLFTLPHLPAGTVANVFASADAHGTVSLIAQLNDGTVARIARDP